MNRRGSALLVTLMINLCLVLLALGLLEKSKGQYGASAAVILEEKARALAWAGLEDCRLKVCRDPLFPPHSDDGQDRFSYVEALYDLDEVTVTGYYRVEIDHDKLSSDAVLRVHSTGLVGPPDKPEAMVRLSGDLDMSETLRGSSPAVPNPDLGKWIQQSDDGSW